MEKAERIALLNDWHHALDYLWDPSLDLNDVTKMMDYLYIHLPEAEMYDVMNSVDDAIDNPRIWYALSLEALINAYQLLPSLHNFVMTDANRDEISFKLQHAAMTYQNIGNHYNYNLY